MKGKAALDMAASPYRFEYPMRRVSERGSQKWERISWETAMSEIALKMKTILGKYGPESITTQTLPPKDTICGGPLPAQ